MATITLTEVDYDENGEFSVAETVEVPDDY